MLGLSIWKILIIAGIVMILFGKGKISEVMGDVAKGIKSFKKGMAEDEKTADTTKPDNMKTIDHNAATGASSTTTENRKAV
jgi:sec-independent protein translocase protein TatA